MDLTQSVSQLKQLFPQIDSTIIELILENTGCNQESAIDQLLALTDERTETALHDDQSLDAPQQNRQLKHIEQITSTPIDQLLDDELFALALQTQLDLDSSQSNIDEGRNNADQTRIENNDLNLNESTRNKVAGTLSVNSINKKWSQLTESAKSMVMKTYNSMRTGPQKDRKSSPLKQSDREPFLFEALLDESETEEESSVEDMPDSRQNKDPAQQDLKVQHTGNDGLAVNSDKSFMIYSETLPAPSPVSAQDLFFDLTPVIASGTFAEDLALTDNYSLQSTQQSQTIAPVTQDQRPRQQRPLDLQSLGFMSSAAGSDNRQVSSNDLEYGGFVEADLRAKSKTPSSMNRFFVQNRDK
ncbi:hypothetical protein MIR68_005066 [Amoeboaphelidium protococcarum]|nr:hypothetical protein MIR68_005066 [Amoeboaphelidium protococcarum]